MTRSELRKHYPEETADITDEGPGIGKTSILFSIQELIKIAPGSEILGVPASDINEIVSPDLRRSMILFKFFDYEKKIIELDVIILTLIVTLFLVLFAIITAELNKY